MNRHRTMDTAPRPFAAGSGPVYDEARVTTLLHALAAADARATVLMRGAGRRGAVDAAVANVREIMCALARMMGPEQMMRELNRIQGAR
jgi:hypothetical protein